MRLLGALGFAAVCLLAVVAHPRCPASGGPRGAGTDPQRPRWALHPKRASAARLRRASRGRSGRALPGIERCRDGRRDPERWRLGGQRRLVDARSRRRRPADRVRTGQVRVGSLVTGRNGLVDAGPDPRRARCTSTTTAVGAGSIRPPSFDWHARTATPADRVFGGGQQRRHARSERRWASVTRRNSSTLQGTRSGRWCLAPTPWSRNGDEPCETRVRRGRRAWAATAGATGGSFTVDRRRLHAGWRPDDARCRLPASCASTP